MDSVVNEPDLVSLAAAKAYLKIPENDPTEDALLTTLIAGLSAQITHYIGRGLVQQTYHELFNGSGKCVLWPKQYPIVSCLALLINDRAIPCAQTIHDRGFRLSQSAIYLQGAIFEKGFQNISVTYIAGQETLSPDITLACLMGIEKAFRNQEKQGALSQSLAGQSVTWPQKEFDDTMKTLLNPFRRIV